MFFGPSRTFKDIFKLVTLRAAEIKDNEYHRSKEEEKKEGIRQKRVKVKFNLEKEPIFSLLLHNMALSSALTLKKKARIRVKTSCVLIGVIDADGILEEGEVFVQIKRDSFEKLDESIDKK